MKQPVVHSEENRSGAKSQEERPKMQPEDFQQNWKDQAEEAVLTVAQWRGAHPQATLAEIEQAVDEQMNRLRAQLIEQAVLPLDMVDNSICPCERIAGWFSPHSTLQVGHFVL